MRIRSDTNDSASLARDAVSDTGRSLYGEGVGITLEIGMTMASFHFLVVLYGLKCLKELVLQY